jgi:predicted nucleotidyltransferase component of viral defense system
VREAGRQKNREASIRQRLLNKAKETNHPFQEILQYYAMERFLYRFSQSQYSEKFILKGALMLTVWDAPLTRPTMDIDMLGHTSNAIDKITTAVKDVCSQASDLDGIVFNPDSVTGIRITEDADYSGVRIRFNGQLDTARITVQLDIGFGDKVFPSAQFIDYPVILDLPKPHIKGYSRESTIAEKFEAMMKLGELNSRMKDFYDIWLLSRRFDYEGRVLAKAIDITFKTRATAISASPTPLFLAFAQDPAKSAQWKAFIRKNRFSNVPVDFSAIVEAIATFLGPLAASLSDGQSFDAFWKAPGPWQG